MVKIIKKYNKIGMQNTINGNLVVKIEKKREISLKIG